VNVGTVAHEVFHQCGLEDIYNSAGDVTVSGPVSPGRMGEADWGGGYYEPDLSQADFNKHRLIMYGEGESGSAAVCLPAGSVYGAGRDPSSPAGYILRPVKVGRDSLKPGQPVHQ